MLFLMANDPPHQCPRLLIRCARKDIRRAGYCCLDQSLSFIIWVVSMLFVHHALLLVLFRFKFQRLEIPVHVVSFPPRTEIAMVIRLFSVRNGESPL